MSMVSDKGPKSPLGEGAGEEKIKLTQDKTQSKLKAKIWNLGHILATEK